MDGGILHKGGSMHHNRALASLISEFHDSTFTSYLEDLHIYNNEWMSE